MRVLSCVQFFVAPWTVARQGSLSMAFSRQVYWSGLRFLLQGVFLTQGSKPPLFICRWILYHCLSAGKEFACNAWNLGSIPGLGRSTGEGKGCTPVFWPGEFHGLYSPWGRKESDMTEILSHYFTSLPLAPPQKPLGQEMRQSGIAGNYMFSKLLLVSAILRYHWKWDLWEELKAWG